MILHDLADPFMEIAKLFFYSKSMGFANGFFAIFALVFIITRDYYYPFMVVAQSFLDYYRVLTYFDAVFLSIPIFLCVLQVLHLFWTVLILRMVADSFRNNGVQGDIREDHDD